MTRISARAPASAPVARGRMERYHISALTTKRMKPCAAYTDASAKVPLMRMKPSVL